MDVVAADAGGGATASRNARSRREDRRGERPEAGESTEKC
jgi:hypothetical protein